MTNNQKAFLDTIAWSEGTSTVLGSDNGYNVIVGGDLFKSYEDHPRVKVWLPKLGVDSTAAGRYQLLARYFDAYKKQLGLSDFSPASQDTIALQQVRESHAINQIEDGDIDEAIVRCGRIWASFPGSPYGQHTHSVKDLRAVFIKAGGTVS